MGWLPVDQIPMTEHVFWMRKALELAKKAEFQGEVPVGAVVVCEGILLGKGWNQSIKKNDSTAHAEIQALRMASRKIHNYRFLPHTTLYVTLEPCAMCAGAMIHARIDCLVFGAKDPKTGVISSTMQFFDLPFHNHQIEVIEGVLAQESSDVLRSFFRSRRNRK